MQPTLREFDDFESAHQAELADNRCMSVDQRLEALMQIMEPFYVAAGRAQDLCRTARLSSDQR